MEKPTHTQVIGITSGKAGVGKTTISVNLAVAIHDMGYNVMLLDANTSASNAQLALGSKCPLSLLDFISGGKSLPEIIHTRHYGIQLIDGANTIDQMTQLNPEQAARALTQFSAMEQDLDFLIIDLPPGTDPSVLSLMACTGRRLVVVRCDDKDGLAEAYAVIKILCSDFGLDRIYVIANGAHTPDEGQKLFDHLHTVAAKFLNRELHFLGSIGQDELMVEAAAHHKSVTEFAPTSSAARDFRKLATATSELDRKQYEEGGLGHFVKRIIHLHDLKTQ
jgi:flagellar biosynthesis protein FlhG